MRYQYYLPLFVSFFGGGGLHSLKLVFTGNVANGQLYNVYSVFECFNEKL